MLRIPWWVACLAVASYLPATVSSATPALNSVSTSTSRFSVSVEKNKVAAGGVRDAAHQSAFTISVSNAQGEPVSGVLVDLPTLWNEHGQINSDKPRTTSPLHPVVEWDSRATLGDKLSKRAVTDKAGVVSGLFTSGQWTGKVKLRAGGAEAVIHQVWNEDKVPWNHPPYMSREHDNPVQYEMSYWSGDEQVRGKNQTMISGHNLSLILKSVRFRAWLMTGGVDEQGVPNTEDEPHEWEIFRPDPQTASVEEKSLWATILTWSKIEGMRETAPGIYQGSFFVALPQKLTPLNGRLLDDVSNVGYTVQDEDVWMNPPAPGG
jgi:hypothetical protein